MERETPTTSTNPLTANQTSVTSDGVYVAGDIHLAQGDFVGRDKIVHFLISGDYNKVFVGDYERLQDAYINPGSIFDRVNLEHFTGREWLLAEVDNFLKAHDRGYFILEADAGLGKTAFLAWLARERHYIHHFSELAPGQEGIGIALRNLAAQLALAYELWPEGMLPSAATRPDYLYNLLKQAAQQRRQDEKIVLLVDALDEAGTPVNQNVLGLPTVLPEGVYLLVSQRPVAVALRVDTASTPRYRLSLDATDPQNQADMRRFLENAATWPRVAQALQENHYTAVQFTATLLDKCRGVWIYLHYVVHEIGRGERSPLDLADLPTGMTQYYAQYWQRWRDTDEIEWDGWYLPLLATLAAAQEAISCRQLLVWLGDKRSERALRRLLEERWRPFLAIDQSKPEHRYRFYHATLQEFFDGRLAQDTLSSSEVALVTELAEETRACHTRFAERYLQAWGGLAAGLPGLQEPLKRDLDEQYGLRYLVAHLVASSRVDDLHFLLRLEWIHSEIMTQSAEKGIGIDQYQQGVLDESMISYQNVWYTVREATGQIDGYLTDVTRAWRLTEKRMENETAPYSVVLDRGIEKNWQLKSIGLQCCYALITASLNSLATNIPSELLTELVKKKVWLPQQGLAYARQVPDVDHRVEALVQLAPYLSTSEQEQVLKEALHLAYDIEDIAFRVEVLVQLAPYLSTSEQEQVLKEALHLAYNIEDIYDQEIVLNLASRLIELGHLPEALYIVYNIEDDDYRAKALARLARHLSASEQEQVLKEALHLTYNIEDIYLRVAVLAESAPYLSAEQLQEALRFAHSIDDSYSQAEALAALAPRLAVEQPQEALRIVRSIEDSGYRARALANLVPYFSTSEQEEVLQEALYIADYQIRFEDSVFRVEVLAASAPYLSVEQLQAALRIAHSIDDIGYRAKALKNLAPRLMELRQLQEALHLARSIEQSDLQAAALVNLVPYLSSGEQEQVLQEALRLASSIEDSSYRAESLAKLVPYLSSEQPQAALHILYSIEDSGYRAEALTQLAPYLSAEQLQAALRIAHRIDDSYSQAKALAQLVSCLSTEQPQEALRITYGITDSGYRAEALAQLAPYLSGEQLQEALRLAHNIEDSPDRAKTLAHLAPRLAAEQSQEAMRFAQSIEDSAFQVEVLAALAPYLSGEQLQEALRLAHNIEDSPDRAMALVHLVPRLTAEQPQEALRLAYNIEDSYHRAEALVELSSYFSAQQPQEALRIAHSIDYGHSRAKALAQLAPYLSTEQLQEALRIAYGITDSGYRAEALAQLAPYLSTEQLQEALRFAQGIANSYPRAEALTQLAPYLSAEQLQEALRFVQSIDDSYSQLAVLAPLVPYLSAEQMQEALRFAQSIDDSDHQVKVLAELAPYLLAEQLQEALRIAQSIEFDPNRARALAELAPYLLAEQMQEALRIAQNINYGYSSFKAEALARLASRLATEQPQEALYIARNIEDTFYRAEALANLVFRLVELPPNDIYMLWYKILPFLSSRTRADLLSDLAALAGLISHLGSASALGEIAQAIQDVCRWWP